MGPAQSSKGQSPWTWACLILLAGAAAGGGLWYYRVNLSSSAKPPPDMVKVLEATNKGIGLIEQFKFAEAQAAFEEAHQLAPDWLPGKINHGIGLLYLARSPSMPPEERVAVYHKAIQVFNQVLTQEPDSAHAHFCLGFIFSEGLNKYDEAKEHFQAVTRIDPRDAHSWYWLGKCILDDEDEVLKDYEHAVNLNPYLGPALEGYWSRMRVKDPQKAEKLLVTKEALRQADTLETVEADYYGDIGLYARVIGRVMDQSAKPGIGPMPIIQRDDHFHVELALGTRWATAADFGTGPVAELRSRVRGRFGATMVVLDYNRDGKPDLLLLGAVVVKGKVRDLLLRNDGSNRFTDVTDEAGLGKIDNSLGCCVGDVDDDGYPDLFVTGIGSQHLLRNTGKGAFEDITAKMGLDKLNTVCLGAAFVDLDHDGDLDLVVAQYADTAENALAALKGAKSVGGGLVVYLNQGEAPPLGGSRTGKEPLLNLRFGRVFDSSAKLPVGMLPHASKRLLSEAEAVFQTPLVSDVAVAGLALSDFDLDHDVDLLVLADRTAPKLIVNDRLLRFHGVALPESLVAAAAWNGALVLDTQHKGRSDLFLVGPDNPPILLLNWAPAGQHEADTWFVAGATNSQPLIQAHAVDLDLDSWTDVVGVSAQRQVVFLHNDGRRLVVEALGEDKDWPRDVAAVAVADFDGDCYPDVMIWSEKAGLELRRSRGNGNHAMVLNLTGRRGIEGSGVKVRSNADGIGTWITAHAGDVFADVELTTRTAGLGQSAVQPVLLGLGHHTQADVMRLRWPDGVQQAELNLPTCQLLTQAETNRKTTSCPILFAWNGQRFGFITDFLGAGSMGEMQPDGGHRPPRPEESVKIEADQLVPLDGQYVLKIAEPMDEATYLDRLELVVIDHPKDVRVYPDERFVSNGPPASQDVLAFRQEIFPVKARDHRGRDVTEPLRHWDRDTVRHFAKRSWLGYAEEHWIELDFGDRLARFGPKDRLFMCLAGWTDYPYPESIFAATQAGVELIEPVLERRGEDGKWHTLIPEAGFPAGLPRMMTLEITGKVGGPRCVLRLRTNMEVYWDQIAVAPHLETVNPNGKASTVRASRLEVSEATMTPRGCMKEFSPDGREPTLFDYDQLEAVPVARLAGKLTRFGDVTELLRDLDDRFVIFGPGDEVMVRFDARGLPELTSGWTRSFVLRTWGYCKDCSPFTATGDTIEPLPFRKMRAYPYGPEEHYPQDPFHQEYQRKFNTRQVGAVRKPSVR